jgi:hypothetical protein
MPDYRIQAGTHRLPNGERAEAGDVVDIPESVATDFPNKFERVDEPESTSDVDEDDETPAALQDDTFDDHEDAVETDDEDGEQAEDGADRPEGTTDDDIGETEAAGDIPDDYALLSKMAKHYDGEEIHGAKSGDEIKDFLTTLSQTEVAALKQQAKEEMAG